mmetsp:Transcript_18808/g.60834  ORF Transcript_18808/g.60834 Transcript_18808/m.60834 type:complete len:334 (-) Transcript_18808:44-1045(-)
MDGVIVAGVDPLLFFFGAAAGGTSIGLGIPESFVSPGAPGLALAEIEQGALADPKSKVVLVVMNPKSDGASADVLVFSPSRTCGKIEVAGPLVRPLDPDLGRDDGELYFKVERRLLDATMFLQWETMTEPHRSQVRMTTLGGLPYMDAATSEPMFICAGTEGKREKRGALGSSKSPKVTCLVCAKEFGAPEMRQHMGFHLIHERETVPAAMPCVFCGGDSAQFSTDLSQLKGCPVWLDKKQPKMRCQLVGDISYSDKAAAKVTKNAPCTNRPIQCPLCPKGRGSKGVVHWKMNMRAHFQQSHPGRDISPELARDLIVTDNEREWTRKFSGNRK